MAVYLDPAHVINRVVSHHDGVQRYMDKVLFEARVSAEQDLKNHKHDGHATIQTERGITDRYLILSDERGQKAALSIEYGREPYCVDKDGSPVPCNSPTAHRRVGGMEGLFILHRALDIKRKKRRGRVKMR